MNQADNDFIVLGDLSSSEDQKRQQLHRLFRELTGRSVKEYLADLVGYVQTGDQWAAILDLKNITGEHLAECNEFYQALRPKQLS